MAKHKKQNRARDLTADLFGIGAKTLQRRNRAAKHGELRDSKQRGARKFDMKSYMEHYREVLLWARHVESIAKRTGVGLGYASFAKFALDDEPFRAVKKARLEKKEAEKEKKMEEEEEEATDQAENAAAAKLVKTEVGALAKGFQDAVAKSKEATVSNEDARVGAEALMEALGMGDTEPDDKLLKQVTWELKKVLRRLGFNVEKLVREALGSMTTKASWSVKFCLKYYDFLTQPAKYTNDFWFMIDESWFYAGEGEKKGIVYASEQHIQKKGTFKRFGLVDGVMVYWEKVPQAKIDANPDYWKRAFASNSLWFFRDGYMLKVRKLRKTAHVWLAQKEKAKETDAVPDDFLQDADGDVVGTMTHELFLNHWYKPKVLDIFKLVKRAKDEEELKSLWPKQEDGTLTDADKADIKELVPLLGRNMTTISDGAGYHKKEHPKYVKRSGSDSLVGVDSKGQVLAEPGWTKERCIWWLWGKENIPQCKTIKKMLKYIEGAPADVKTTYATYTDKHVTELRKMVDELAVRLKYQVVKATLEVGVVWTRVGVDKYEKFDLDSAPEVGDVVTDLQLSKFAEMGLDIFKLIDMEVLDHGFKFLWTPPYIGKWLNIIEELWNIVKSKARVNIPIPDRNKDPKVKAGLYEELVGACTQHRQLQNTLLNSMRFCFASVKATFHGLRVVYKGKPVLFQELHESFHDFGCQLLQGEADELSDPLMAPQGVELVEPRTLATDQLPRGIQKTLPTMEKISTAAAEHAVSIQQAKRAVRKPLGPQPPKTDIGVGSWVLYWSKTNNRYAHSHVRKVNEDGTLDLNTKSKAKRENIKLPHVQHVPPKPPGAPRAAKKAKAKPQAAAAAGDATPVDFMYEPPAGAVFAGAPVVSLEWDPEGENWEVGLLRDGDVLTRLVSPGDWPYTLPPRALCEKEAKAASQKEAEGGAADEDQAPAAAAAPGGDKVGDVEDFDDFDVPDDSDDSEGADTDAQVPGAGQDEEGDEDEQGEEVSSDDDDLFA